MCRPAGISLILVLVACQQSVRGRSGHEWTITEIGFDDDDNSTVRTYLKDMPKEERENLLGYVKKAMKLYDEAFHLNIKESYLDFAGYLFYKYVYKNKNVVADTYKEDIKMWIIRAGIKNRKLIATNIVKIDN
ncbi:hypothetical protein GE061_010302 [Apolygus lucorum]|uniref:Uncharacterized protein n=1 Tax=Apolygus lucorum TaxID=248454 RepID=A0A8S9Y5C3_APOLU|nr:hypothetical protein GE061_010302 [Apolygus lucorum]